MIYVKVKDKEEFRIITVLVDVIQFSNYEDVFNKIKSTISDMNSLIVLDLTKVKFMDSLSLGMLVPLMLYTRRLDGDMALVAPDPKVKELFRILRLDRIMTLYDNVETAIEKMSEGVYEDGI